MRVSGYAGDGRFLKIVEFTRLEPQPNGAVLERVPISETIGDELPKISYHADLVGIGLRKVKHGIRRRQGAQAFFLPSLRLQYAP